MGASSSDEELNLVPFIDLFSVLICFLLMTAVWMQIDSLSTNVDSVTSSDAASDDPQEKKVSLMITILTNEIQMAENEKTKRLGLRLDEQGRPALQQVISVLAQWRTRYPDKKDIVLNTDNRVSYQTMISVFDTLVGEGWPDVGVSTQ